VKKFLFILAALTLVSSALFADDAKVMPAQVGRFFIVPTYGSATTSYDADGRVSTFDPIKMFNLGFALEYGITDWISGAAQWAPGWTTTSDLNSKLPTGYETAKANMDDLADLFVGAKIQLVGEKAPVSSTKFRVALAPGILIPLTSGPNFKDELSSISGRVAALVPGLMAQNPGMSQSDAIDAATQQVLASSNIPLSNMDKHSFATGWRAYFDLILSENLFINFFNETLFYLQKKDINNFSPNFAMYDAIVAGGLAGTGEVDYKHKISLEVEPVVSAPLSPAVGFQFCLPLRYVYAPAYAYSFSSTTGANIQTTPFALDSASHKSLTFTPAVMFFVMNTFMPLEFRLQYGIPVYVRNGTAMETLTFQVRAYFKT